MSLLPTQNYEKKKGVIDTKIIIRVIKMYGFEKDVEEVKNYFVGKDVEFDVNVLNSWPEE